MSGKKSSPDPFAGYTPVVRFPSVGNASPSDVPDLPKPKKYSFRKKEKKSSVRTLVGFVQVALFAFAVLLVALFAYGFIYRQTFAEPLPLLGSLTNQVQRVAAAGMNMRLSIGGSARTNAPVRVRFPVQVDSPAQVDAPVRVDAPVQTNVTTRGANAPEAKNKRQVDPEMKRFYNGGRKGRTMGPKERE